MFTKMEKETAVLEIIISKKNYNCSEFNDEKILTGKKYQHNWCGVVEKKISSLVS